MQELQRLEEALRPVRVLEQGVASQGQEGPGEPEPGESGGQCSCWCSSPCPTGATDHEKASGAISLWPRRWGSRAAHGY